MHSDPLEGLPATLFERIRGDIEAIPLPTGYSLEWGGEYEDSGNAQRALAETLLLFLLAMVLIVLVFFNALKITTIIWITVPFLLIGSGSGP